MSKVSLKSRLDGNSLDLSLNELAEPPVKDLAELPKAVKLDLSCNKIAVLPDAFCGLTHLKELDLSKNQLRELPTNFGRLSALQKLDLYGNNLTTLPLSMCRMKALRWLDLKGNPLEPRLKAVAGDCLDEKQCQQCAKKVVEYLQAQESELEREKQKRLRAQREQEALRKAEEEKEAERQRLEKKAEREKKKAEQRQKKEQQLKQKQQLLKEMEVTQEKLKQTKKDGKQSTKLAPGHSKRGGCFSMLMTLVLRPSPCGGVPVQCSCGAFLLQAQVSRHVALRARGCTASIGKRCRSIQSKAGTWPAFKYSRGPRRSSVWFRLQ
nr:leucine-rich repeat-containing protein 59-like [Rhipicephalus microplus]